MGGLKVPSVASSFRVMDQKIGTDMAGGEVGQEKMRVANLKVRGQTEKGFWR